MPENFTYPFENLNIDDMDGEQWDDAPVFDGSYLVSNYGRIKSLRRWRSAGSKGGGYYTQERIIKIGVGTSLNKHLNINTYSLAVTLKHDGQCYSTHVARLVYYLFVDRFDIDNVDIKVSYKDCNGKNLHSSNLFLTDRSGLNKKSYKLKRSFSQWQQNKIPVLQTDLSGSVIATFGSLTEASKRTGFNLGAIAECTKGNIFQHKGYKWKIASDNLNPEPAKTAERKNKKSEIFNKYLWEKIGKPKTSRLQPIPVLNLSLDSLKGEVWKPIEGWEVCFEVSNAGRIKSVGRLKGNNVWLMEHILRLVPDGNRFRATSSLLVSLKRNGKSCQKSIARLVYYHFVEKFDLNDKTIRVYCKDKCFYNLDYKNLAL